MVKTLANGAVPRSLPSWIESFSEYTSGIQSPAIFRKWAAISIIAGALERKVWVRAFSRTLYPNMYLLLTGGPGIGKTESLREVQDFWSALPNFHVAPSQVSRASLIDAVNDAKRSIFIPTAAQPLTTFNSLNAAISEFGTFLQVYENSFMSFLNDLYDCVKAGDRKRGLKEEIKIPNPQFNFIAGTTPGWLGSNLPVTAWAEGFASRLFLIHSGQRILVDPFYNVVRDQELLRQLTSDLESIHELYGQMAFDDDVAARFKFWYSAGCPPVPEHPKLEHYIPRRHIHFLKLLMVKSVSRSNELIIRMDDYQHTMNLFLDAEASMPDVFKAMTSGLSGDSAVLEETYRFVWEIFSKEKRAVDEHRIMHFISYKMNVPSYNCLKILEVMVGSNLLTIKAVGERGRNTYEPTPRTGR